MRKFWSILGRVVKAVVIVAVGSAIRISRGQGEGVFEKAMQDAAAEMAQRYLRRVNTR
jgi:hypothetical protein